MPSTKRIPIFLLIPLLALWFVGCSTPSKTVIHHLSAEDVRSLIIQNGSNPEFVILDIRTPKEFKQGHIAGAVLLDYYNPNFRKGLQKLDKSKTYLIYCRTGNRTSRTLAIIENMGFKTIYHLQRGIVEWYAQKLPLVKS